MVWVLISKSYLFHCQYHMTIIQGRSPLSAVLPVGVSLSSSVYCYIWEDLEG